MFPTAELNAFSELNEHILCEADHTGMYSASVTSQRTANNTKRKILRQGLARLEVCQQDTKAYVVGVTNLQGSVSGVESLVGTPQRVSLDQDL